MSNTEFKRPGGELSQDHLFEQRLDQTGKEIGVKTPEGVMYFFLDDERLSFDYDGKVRIPYIVKKDGAKVLFEEWVKEVTGAYWKYDARQGVIIAPDGHLYKTVDELPDESLREIAMEIRRVTDESSTWPTDIAQAITMRFLAMRHSKT